MNNFQKIEKIKKNSFNNSGKNKYFILTIRNFYFILFLNIQALLNCKESNNLKFLKINNFDCRKYIMTNDNVFEPLIQANNRKSYTFN